MGTNRVIRGGSWNSNARNVRAAYRNGNHPDNRNDNLGLRLAALWPMAADQVSIASGVRAGKHPMGAGVVVGAAERPASPRRLPAGVGG